MYPAGQVQRVASVELDPKDDYPVCGSSNAMVTACHAHAVLGRFGEAPARKDAIGLAASSAMMVSWAMVKSRPAKGAQL